MNDVLDSESFDVTDLTGDEIVMLKKLLLTYAENSVSDLLEFIEDEISEREAFDNEQYYDYQTLHLY